MSEWKEYKLKDICLKITDGSHKSPKAQSSGYPMFSVKDMEEYGFNYNDCKLISSEDFAEMKSTGCVPEKDDILIAKDGSYLKQIFICKESREEAILSSIAIFRPDKNIIEPRFLMYLLKSPQVFNYIKTNCVSGSAIPRIVLKSFKDVSMRVPESLTEQKRISNFLEDIDNKIITNRRICENLEAQAQALFKHWFIDFAPFLDKPSGKAERKNGKFVESELGMIPEGWRVGTLEELVDIKYGKDHKKLKEGYIPAYGSAGLMRTVDEKLYDGESVLIPRKGTLNNIMYVNEAFWTVDTMFYTIPKKTNILKYIYMRLKRIDFNKMNVGTSIPSNSTSQLNKMEIIVPTDEILSHFDRIMSSLLQEIMHFQKESKGLATLRDTLLPRLMSGKIKIIK